jgi:hypothetical protein
MLYYNGKQYIEGIDKITVMIQPYLYPFLNQSFQLDKYNKIKLLRRRSYFQTSENDFHTNHYFYLVITGEYINPELPIKDAIANAIYELFSKGLLNIIDYKNNIILNDISIDIIKDNLHLFIAGINEIEFCFDFKIKNIAISRFAEIIKPSDDAFKSFIKTDVRKRKKCLIRIGDTYYSSDYKSNRRRKSSLKLYNRGKWLLKKNNEYPKQLINNNPYKMRLEFVLKLNSNTQYLTVDNLEGNYEQIIHRFIPYLAKLYRKYFRGLVLIDTFKYEYFHQIYTIAYHDSINTYKKLENRKTEKKRERYIDYPNYYFPLVNILRRYKRGIDKYKELFYMELFKGFDVSSIPCLYTPFNIMDKDNILYKDDNFVMLKNQYYLPKFKTIL